MVFWVGLNNILLYPNETIIKISSNKLSKIVD